MRAKERRPFKLKKGCPSEQWQVKSFRLIPLKTPVSFRWTVPLNCFTIGLIRYLTEGLESDKFLSDIGLGNIDVGYRISATKVFDVAPAYANI
jgi:hypothetical protein